MFERYTENAKRTLFFARYEAGQSGAPSIDTLHLLLGLIREPQAITARIFAEAGLSLPDVRREIYQVAGNGPPISTSREIPFHYDVQNALRAAAEEADRLLHDHVGPEHLLLGLLRIEESGAARLLTEKGLRIAPVRDAIVVSHSRGGRPERLGPPQRRTPQAVIADAWDGDERFVDLPVDAHRDLAVAISEGGSSASERSKARLRDAIEKRFTVRRETRAEDVYLLTTGPGGPGPALRRHRQSGEGGVGGGVGFVSAAFSTRHGEPFHDRTPRFIDRFSAAGMPFEAICKSLEQLLGRPLVDETGLSGSYDVELTGDPQTVDSFIQSLREEAGLVITPATRDVPHLIVQRR
jgi:uncharacterized protein (TIGR03435 family)